VKSIALWVDDAESAWTETTARGALSVQAPITIQDERGSARLSSIAIYGDTVHTFVERRNYQGAFLPGFAPVPVPDRVSRPAGLLHVDHIESVTLLRDQGLEFLSIPTAYYDDLTARVGKIDEPG